MEDKKLKIINAVISLINEGASREKISISSIAKRADIGKSTVYEYFQSKNELLIETFICYIESEIETLKNIITDLDDFMLILEKIIESVMIMEQGKHKYIQFALNSSFVVSLETFKDSHISPDEILDRYAELILPQIARLSELAKNGGYIENGFSSDKFFTAAIAASTVATSQRCGFGKYFYKEMSREELIKYCTDVMLKLLK